MTVDELKAYMESLRKDMAEANKGAWVLSSPEGPVKLAAIEAILKAIVDLDRRLRDLERRADEPARYGP